MEWFNRIVHVVRVGLFLMKWFDQAKQDGVITLEEMTSGITQLLEVAGLADDVKIELKKEVLSA